jgi:hypothetical protein
MTDSALTQRLAALEKANRTRSFRAQIKRDLRAGRITLAQLIAHPPAELGSMRLYELLLATPKIGTGKATRILRRAALPASKTVATLTARQRHELLTALTGCGEPRELRRPAEPPATGAEHNPRMAAA